MVRPPSRDPGHDGPVEVERRRPIAPVAPAAAALALAALVAAASRGTPVWTALRDGDADRADVLNRAVEVGVLGVLIAATLILVLHFALYGRGSGAVTIRQSARRLLPLALLSVAVFALFSLARTDRLPETPPRPGALQLDWFPGLGLANAPEGEATGVAVAEADSVETGAAPPEAGSPSWVLMLLFAAVTAGVAAVLARQWLGRRSPLVQDAEEPEQTSGAEESHEMREALLGIIEEMLADPDPRRAIIGAYARLLECLSASDARRRDHEAPFEHLQRVLLELHVRPEPLRELTELFEIARFSTRPLTERHRNRALEALGAAVAGLRTTSARHSAAAFEVAASR